MSESVLILGDSGTGKSSSIRTLPPEETFVLSVIGKNLPFRGAGKSFTKLNEDGLTGNFYASDNFDKIRRIINLIDKKRTDIKYLVIDDFGFSIMNEFIRNANVKGYDKFVLIAKEFSEALNMIRYLRDDLFCFVTMHVETQQDGKTKPKTVGKMIDQYVCIEGNFTNIFHTAIIDKQYKFITNNDGLHMAKSSMGLFDEQYIDNDLMMIATRINEYNNEDITQ